MASSIATRRAMARLVAMRGFAGSGKSTVSRELGRRLGWPVIDKDNIMDLLYREIQDSGRISYDVMFNIARTELSLGMSVICDSPLTFRTMYEQAKRTAVQAGARLVVVECVCPCEIEWQLRIDARKSRNLPSHHQTDWETFKPYRDDRSKRANYPVDPPHLVVDTTRSLYAVADETEGWLRAL